MKHCWLLGLWLAAAGPLAAQAVKAPAPYGVLPAERQLRWHEMGTYTLMHFTPTTFEDKEWGFGDADPKTFNPTDFNAEQIVQAVKAGGFKGLILVAKHHDGFCLWPTKTTDYNISKSPFRNGKGDMVREMADAARRHGLRFGIYCSPWDRNAASYGTPQYLSMYREQLRELYTQYGPLFTSWHDGANGGDGYYGGARQKRSIDRATYYDWDNTWGQLTRKLQPGAVIFSDVGWDVRWAGNEEGVVNPTSWHTYTPEPPVGMNAAVPGQSEYKTSPTGTRNGRFWMPAECDVPLRPGWFFHEKENNRVKSDEKLFDLYLKSVGRGASLDVGIAPDTRGQLHPNDVAVLKTFGERLRQTFGQNLAQNARFTPSNVRGRDARRFGTAALLDADPYSYWATDDAETRPELLVTLPRPLSLIHI